MKQRQKRTDKQIVLSTMRGCRTNMLRLYETLVKARDQGIVTPAGYQKFHGHSIEEDLEMFSHNYKQMCQHIAELETWHENDPRIKLLRPTKKTK